MHRRCLVMEVGGAVRELRIAPGLSAPQHSTCHRSCSPTPKQTSLEQEAQETFGARLLAPCPVTFGAQSRDARSRKSRLFPSRSENAFASFRVSHGVPSPQRPPWCPHMHTCTHTDAHTAFRAKNTETGGAWGENLCHELLLFSTSETASGSFSLSHGALHRHTHTRRRPSVPIHILLHIHAHTRRNRTRGERLRRLRCMGRRIVALHTFAVDVGDEPRYNHDFPRCQSPASRPDTAPSSCLSSTHGKLRSTADPGWAFQLPEHGGWEGCASYSMFYIARRSNPGQAVSGLQGRQLAPPCVPYLPLCAAYSSSSHSSLHPSLPQHAD